MANLENFIVPTGVTKAMLAESKHNEALIKELIETKHNLGRENPIRGMIGVLEELL